MSIQDNFRLAMRRYIYSVSIMSNRDSNDNPNAITVSSVTSISMEPPSILICINKSSKIHDSIVLGSKFCINLLTKDQHELSNICSDDQKHDQRFADQNWNLDNLLLQTIPFQVRTLNDYFVHDTFFEASFS